MRVLIVEDEDSLSKALEERLLADGIKVSTAQNGDEARKLLAKNEYDVILLDILMPLVNGWEVLDSIDPSKRKSVIMITNLNDEKDRLRAESMGVLEYVLKSDVTLEEIVLKVYQIAGLKKDV